MFEPPVAADHLRALLREMPGDGGQKVGGGEDLKEPGFSAGAGGQPPHCGKKIEL